MSRTTDTKNPPNQLYVGNLTKSVDQEDLDRACRKFGKHSILWFCRHETRNTGYAFVAYDNAEDAEAAIHGLDGSSLRGTQLQVRFREDGRKQNREPPSATNTTCYGCGKLGHKKKDCRKEQRPQITLNKRGINEDLQYSRGKERDRDRDGNYERDDSSESGRDRPNWTVDAGRDQMSAPQVRRIVHKGGVVERFGSLSPKAKRSRSRSPSGSRSSRRLQQTSQQPPSSEKHRSRSHSRSHNSLGNVGGNGNNNTGRNNNSQGRNHNSQSNRRSRSRSRSRSAVKNHARNGSPSLQIRKSPPRQSPPQSSRRNSQRSPRRNSPPRRSPRRSANRSPRDRSPHHSPHPSPRRESAHKSRSKSGSRHRHKPARQANWQLSAQHSDDEREEQRQEEEQKSAKSGESVQQTLDSRRSNHSEGGLNGVANHQLHLSAEIKADIASFLRKRGHVFG